MVLMLDADVLVAAPFEAMVVQAHRHQALAGLIAYSSPFENTGLNMTWPELFREFGLATPELNHTHTGFGVINVANSTPESMGALMRAEYAWRGGQA